MASLRMLHQPYEPYAYSLSGTEARVVLAVESRFAQGVRLHYDDRYVQDLTNELTMTFAGSGANVDYFTANVPVPTHKLKYTFEVVQKTNNASLWYGENGISDNQQQAGVFQLAYLSQRDIFRTPDWAKSAVCYQIFPERFENGNPELTPAGSVPWDSEPTPFGMYGGDLPGIRARLGYLKEQGVNLIYLTPIFKAGSNHKYDTEDYLEIDPQFGTKQDLRDLVMDAHREGIRIVLDAVFNHSGYQFGPFQDVLQNGRKSGYWDWFFIDGDEVDTEDVNYETFATKLRYMPKLNVANPAVEGYLLKVARYWIDEFDIDGWRLDVANEVDHVFWKKFRDTVKAAKPDALIIGEVWHNSLPWLRGDEFDSVMNYVFREAVHAYFIRREASARRFGQAVTDLLFMYPDAATHAMFNLLGSHDTERVLTLAGGDVNRVLQAMTFQFIYPGIPMVYYGDEIGMEGGADPGCRRGMVWDETRQDARFRRAMMQLAKLKHSEPALASGTLRLVHAERNKLEFIRETEDDPVIHVAFNTGYTPWQHKEVTNVVFESFEGAWRNGRIAPGGAVVWKS